MSKKKFQTVSLDAETKESLVTASKLSGKSQNRIIGEILRPLARQLASFDPREKPVGFWVDVTIEPPKIQLTVYGRKRLMQITAIKQNEEVVSHE